MCFIVDIERICANSSGGVSSELTLICPQDIKSYPRSYCHTRTISENIEFKEGKKPLSISAIKESGSYISRHVSNKRSGDSYENRFAFRVSSHREQVENLASQAMNNTLHIIYVDKNGNRRLVPCLKFKIDVFTGSALRDRNEYRIIASGRSEKIPPFFNGQIIYN